MTELQIIIPREDDLSDIMKIEGESSSMWKPSFFLQEMENSFSYFYAAVHDNKIAGFIIGWLVADQIEIQNIAVAKDFRRQGIATYLITYLIDNNPAKGQIKKLLLEVKESNETARQFYLALKFNEVGIRKNYYSSGDHAVLLERIIDHEL